MSARSRLLALTTTLAVAGAVGAQAAQASTDPFAVSSPDAGGQVSASASVTDRTVSVTAADPADWPTITCTPAANAPDGSTLQAPVVTGNGTGTVAFVLEDGAGTYGGTCTATGPGQPAQTLELGPWTVTGPNPWTVTAAAPGSVPGVPAGWTPGSSSLPSLFALPDSGWSGYVEPAQAGQAFTGATGTFNVPSTDMAAAGTADAVWVGIDGSGDAYLLQAGVSLNPGSPPEAWYVNQSDPDNPDENAYAAENVPIILNTGDTVTVTLTQQSAGQWLIAVTDDSTGQGFQVPVAYTGPAATAEWITEAPGGPQPSGHWPVAAFSPITWTTASTAGGAPNPTGTKVYVLDQGNTLFDTVTPFADGTFTEDYGPQPFSFQALTVPEDGTAPPTSPAPVTGDTSTTPVPQVPDTPTTPATTSTPITTAPLPAPPKVKAKITRACQHVKTTTRRHHRTVRRTVTRCTKVGRGQTIRMARHVTGKLTLTGTLAQHGGHIALSAPSPMPNSRWKLKVKVTKAGKFTARLAARPGFVTAKGTRLSVLIERWDAPSAP